MSRDEMMNLLQKISEDVAMTRIFVRLLASEEISAILRKIASTPERQQMWRLADGSKSNEEIAKVIGVALRSVQYFAQDAQDASLIVMKKRGYPCRIAEVFPPEWKSWKPKSEGAQQKADQESTVREGASDV